MNDDELRSTLAKWDPYEPSLEIAERTWTAFGRRRRPAWKRALTVRLNVPVPVATLAGLIILALGVWAGIAFRPGNKPEVIVRTTKTEPVVVEKVVTRKVFIQLRVPAYKAKPQPLTLAGFRPISEIELEVIRRN